MTTIGLHDLVVTREMSVPVSRVWAAWTTSELVAQWWGGPGVTVIAAEVDASVGSSSLLGVRRADGVDEYIRFSYLVVEPERSLEFLFDWVDSEGSEIDPTSIGIPAGIHRHVPHHLRFVSTGLNNSTFTVTELGYSTQELAETARPGLVETLDRIESLLTH